jgi:hypothetical protein
MRRAIVIDSSGYGDALRPPLAEDRLQVDGDGALWLTLRRPWNV